MSHQRIDIEQSQMSQVVGKAHNWRHGRDKHGPIRANQLWRKRDAGILMRIVGRNRNEKWTVDYMKFSSKSSHTLKERDIWKYYDKVS